MKASLDLKDHSILNDKNFSGKKSSAVKNLLEISKYPVEKDKRINVKIDFKDSHSKKITSQKMKHTKATSTVIKLKSSLK
jgi:hypothetical protein